MLFQLKSLADNDRDPGYTEAVLNALHEANPKRIPIQLEYATLNRNVGLFCRCSDKLRRVVTQQFADAYPTCRFEPIADDALTPRQDAVLYRADLRLTAAGQ